MPAPKEVVELIERFDEHVDDYRNGRYNETQLRRDYLDPLLKALGWDVDNVQGFAEAYREVVHEDIVKIGGNTKSPDYSCRIGSMRKFFVEAKKPSIDIKGEPAPAFQLRRYAWSAKLPLSILTDFEEFAVYDCRVRPHKTDKAATARIHYWTYKDYTDKWDEIAAIFSKAAVLKGSFDKYAVTTKGRRGTAEVDEAFLDEIEGWREALAKDIARNNEELSQPSLNWAVQQTIDRIIFLRIAEDRGIEPYGQLQALHDGHNVYARLKELFQKADDRYNSGLFHFKKEPDRREDPDRLTISLRIEDKTLKEILKNLYPPDSPYEFSVLGADILGSVYERFLGKAIRLTAGHHAKIEEKPEVKKAGGVYYTPTYIVDYIVKHTVGRLLEGRTTKDAEKLRILDPACGSGSFLIGAYQYLLDWHRDWYVNDGTAKHASGKNPKLHPGRGGAWRLTTTERKRILVNNIYGVDIDSQAVEVTKLALLLKLLEGETQLEMFHERLLPDLGDNIKCGNSLIGSDFYGVHGSDLIDDETRRRVNVFDWDKGFPKVINAGGFDAVIGNPPYLKEYTYREPFHDLKGTRLEKYYQGKMDIWYIFACHSLDLLKEGGLHSFIATNNWITNAGASILRTKIGTETRFLKFVDFGDFRVFKTASIQTMIYLLQKNQRSPTVDGIRYRRITEPKLSQSEVEGFLGEGRCDGFGIAFEASLESAANGSPFTFTDFQDSSLLRKIKARGSYCLSEKDVAQGIVAPQDFVTQKHIDVLGGDDLQAGAGIFVLDDAEKQNMSLSADEDKIVKPYYTSEELGRYSADSHNRLWVIYTPSDIKEHITKYPHIKKHLDRFKDVITSDFGPYGLHRARDERFFVGRKIVSLRKTSRPQFSYSEFPCYVSQTFNVIKPSDIDLKYLLGILNSRVVYYWLDKKGKKQGDQLQVDKEPLVNIPIRIADKQSEVDKQRRDQLVELVDQMIVLHGHLGSARTPHEKERIQRQIEALNSRIDRHVYDLYELTEDEIRLIEAAT
ncbi:MAG: hypothetical protein AMS22_10440 [Thiotrichales bacterium SG8_50]|nr:MAG: hypothetical protein AMS22_10440 [Thiotrichales bacterium SG8_50]